MLLERRAQLALRAATLRQLLALWPVFDPNDLWPSWNRLEPALLALVQARSRDSAGLAGAFYTQARLEAVTEPYTALLAPSQPDEYLISTLRLTGPVQAEKLLAVNARQVTETAFVNTAGNVSRLVLNAGRDTTLANIAADPQARGYRRITSGKACEFCRMLAGRGAVYSADSVDFRAHNHCGCTAAPVFT